MSYKVSLKNFEGPLDLLLHLIKKEQMDIYDIPIARILDQYMNYIRLMEALDISIAGDFLVMASTLMFIKSKMLLPDDIDEEEEDDPRVDLVQQLLEYKTFKKMALYLQDMENKQKDIFYRGHKDEVILGEKEVIPNVGLFDLMNAFSECTLTRKKTISIQEIVHEEITVEECVTDIMGLFELKDECLFQELLEGINSHIGLLCMFLALLELVRQTKVTVHQKEDFGHIYLKKTMQQTFILDNSKRSVLV